MVPTISNSGYQTLFFANSNKIINFSILKNNKKPTVIADTDITNTAPAAKSLTCRMGSEYLVIIVSLKFSSDVLNISSAKINAHKTTSTAICVRFTIKNGETTKTYTAADICIRKFLPVFTA